LKRETDINSSKLSTIKSITHADENRTDTIGNTVGKITNSELDVVMTDLKLKQSALPLVIPEDNENSKVYYC